MSQYSIKPINPRHTITVGWDKPLDSYFATVITEKDNIEEVVLLSLNAPQPQLLSAVLVAGEFIVEALPVKTLHSLWSDRDGVAF